MIGKSHWKIAESVSVQVGDPWKALLTEYWYAVEVGIEVPDQFMIWHRDPTYGGDQLLRCIPSDVDRGATAVIECAAALQRSVPGAPHMRNAGTGRAASKVAPSPRSKGLALTGSEQSGAHQGTPASDGVTWRGPWR